MLHRPCFARLFQYSFLGQLTAECAASLCKCPKPALVNKLTINSGHKNTSFSGRLSPHQMCNPKASCPWSIRKMLHRKFCRCFFLSDTTVVYAYGVGVFLCTATVLLFLSWLPNHLESMLYSTKRWTQLSYKLYWPRNALLEILAVSVRHIPGLTQNPWNIASPFERQMLIHIQW